jgi:heme-degrading monooxygenase HmoA
MSNFLVIHTVEDYKKWKAIFDEHASVRKEYGGKGATLFRNADDPNTLVILWDWESTEKAREFAQSDSLRDAMQRAGVQGMPTIIFLEEIEKVKV